MSTEENTTSIIEESLLMGHWEGERIEDTLAYLRPWLEYRQHIARQSHRTDFSLLLPLFKNVNKEILKILHIPNK